MTDERITNQNKEFDACGQLAAQLNRVQLTPVVDDDYPEVRHGYESALRTFIDAIRANGRLKNQPVWIKVSDRMPDHREPVVYRRPGRLGRWDVGIAYWCVSQHWVPQHESSHNPDGFTEWMPLPL